mgnify:FL=1
MMVLQVISPGGDNFYDDVTFVSGPQQASKQASKFPWDYANYHWLFAKMLHLKLAY